jgi:pyrroloquinoline quinone (PQQ) biosynthesis protein C
MPVRMVKAMLRHQAEEFDHGEMALRDHVALGGDEQHARHGHRISPAAYSVAAIWRMIANQRDPFAYLGALYPFEGLTPIVSERIKAALLRRGFPADALEFVEFHSTEDPKHTDLVKHLIKETVTRYPGAERSIKEGLDRFLAIYPLPVWQTAYERALSSLPQGVA